jgi:hypothetical protein
MLDSERQKRLEEIRFEWGLAILSWDESYALLQKARGALQCSPVAHKRMEQILVRG